MSHYLKSCAHLTGLWAIAFAQPILLLLAGAPEFFVAHDADPGDILILTAAVSLSGPLVLGALVLFSGLAGRNVSDVVTAVLAGALAAGLVVQIAYRLNVATWVGAGIVAALVMGVVCAAWLTLRAARTFLSVLSPAAIVVPLLFLTSAGIRPLVWPEQTRTVGAASGASVPIVLVVFDELSLVALLDERSQIDPERYPHMWALAHDGVWFRNATAVSDYTRWALPAIVTGRYPRPDSVPTASNHPYSLFTLLAPAYRLEVIEPITRICPPALCHASAESRVERLRKIRTDVQVVAAYVLLPPAERVGLPDLTQAWAGFQAAGDVATDGGTETPSDERIGLSRLEEARSFIDGISESDTQPTLYFLHTLTTHHPPRWLPSGQVIADRRGIAGRLKNGNWGEASWPVIQHFQGHLLQAGVADTLVGRLIDRLKKAGLYDRALVVVTADHGASFRPGDHMRSFTGTNAADIMPVPLIVKLPRLEGERGASVKHSPSERGGGASAAGTVDDRNVETIDILPTIAAVLGIDLPWTVDGTSALATSERRREKKIYSGEARRVRAYLPEDLARERRTALDRQLAIFGTGVWPGPLLPGFETLIDKSVASLAMEEESSGLRLHISRPFAFEDVDVDAPSVPAQVGGWVEPTDRVARTPAAVAIALNGQIVATTQTAPGQAGWSAIVPPSRLKNGPNRLEAFLLRSERPDALYRTRGSLGAREPNLVSPQASLWGVAHSGLYRSEKGGGGQFRWTDGAAIIDVPIEPEHPPSAITASIVFSGQAGKAIRIRVDGCDVLSEVLTGGAWSRTIPLGRCVPPGYWARIEIRSDTHTPPGRDTRRLGVGLARVTLE
jgi:hypothetical protein